MTLFVSSDMDSALLSLVRGVLQSRYRNLNILRLPKFTRFPAPVASHPDLLLFPSERGILLPLEYYEENKGLFSKIGTSLIPVTLPCDGGKERCRYPDDVTLSALVLCGEDGHKKLICREKSISHALLDAEGGEVIPVSQGYARCGTLRVTERAVITADKGIAAAAQSVGADVLLISEGGIMLTGYDTGFIGGASARLGDCIFFFGDPLSHPDGKEMLEFIYSALEAEDTRGKLPPRSRIVTSDGELRDLGSALLV